MIVAGIGLTTRAAADEIVALIDRALQAVGRPREALAALATLDRKAALPAVQQAAQTLRLPIAIPDRAALDTAGPRCATRSDQALAAHGLPSVAEAAALAVAGPAARLILPRIQSKTATCALAESCDP